MKINSHLFQLIILVLTLSSCSSSIYYLTNDTDRNVAKIEFDNYFVLDSCKLNDDIRLISAFKKTGRQYDMGDGISLYAINKKTEVVYKGKPMGDSQILTLKTYKNKNLKETFILGHIANEYSWGNLLYFAKGSVIQYIGLLNIATFPESKYNEYWDISDYLSIKKTANNHYEIRVTKPKFVYDPGGEKQKTYAADQFYYVFDGKSVQEVKP